MLEREIIIGLTNGCQDCDLKKFKQYCSNILSYCALLKTYLQFREHENGK